MRTRIKKSDFLKHLQDPPKGLIKFLLLLAVLLAYFGYLNWEYSLATSGMVAALTWSFFVLCTPIADAGFLLDFPVRLITGLRMFTCEIYVWAVAIILNIGTLYLAPQTYESTFLTSLMHKILITPWPYWSIIVLSGAGTFLSLKLGDEAMDVISRKDRASRHKRGFKYKLIALAGSTLLIIWLYYLLVDSLGVELPS